MKIGRDFIFNILQSVSSILFPLVTFPYASRILGPEGIGIVNFADNFCRYFMLFAALGIPVYGIREIAKTSANKDERSKVFSEIITIHGLTSLISVLIYYFIILYFHFFSENLALYALGGIYIAVNLFSVEWYFNGMSEFKFIALRGIIIRFFFIGLLFFMVKSKNDVIWYFALNVISLLLNNAVNIFFLRGEVNFVWRFKSIKRHLYPLLMIFSTTVAISLYILIDTLILGFLKPAEFVGYYSLATKVNKVPLAIIVALGGVLIPQLTQAAHQKNMSLFGSLIDKSTDFVIMTGVPITVGLFLCAFPIIALFGGVAFHEAHLSMKILSAVSLTIGFSNIYGLQILTPLGKDKLLFKCVAVGTLVSLILNFSLIPLFADRGAAVANITSEIVVTIITYMAAVKIVPLKSPLLQLFKQILSYTPLLIIGIAMHDYINNNVSSLIFVGVGAVTTFLITNIFILKTPLLLEVLQALKNKIKNEEV